MTTPDPPRGRSPAAALLFVLFAAVAVFVLLVLFGVAPLGF